MTRTLTSTPAEWEVLQRDRTAWIVRDDPAELVAAAAPCETCRGQREVVVDEDEFYSPCPDCRITLLGECPDCWGHGAWMHADADVYGEPGEPHPVPCERCQTAGRLELGYAYADSDVLPIVDGEEHPNAWPDLERDELAVWDDESVSWRRAGQPWPAISLSHYTSRSSLVGKYALKLVLA